MEALLTAIFRTLTTDLSQKAFMSAAPRDTKFPYTIFSQVDTFQEAVDTSGERINNVVIRFNFWDADSDRVSQTNDKTKDFYLKNNITLDESECLLNTQLSSEALELDPDMLENGKEVWHGVLDLLFLDARQL